MTRKSLLPWLMWLFPLIFFAYQFILRLYPGLVLGDLMAKYQVNARDFGYFAALYYVGYAGMQIPMALLLDRFGARIIISLSALLCGFAILLQQYTDTWAIAMLSRFLIGVGSVVGFLGTSKVISMWFPKERYARLVGLTFSFGLLGALYGGRPVSLMIEHMGWERVFSLLGIVAIVIGLIVLSFVRDKKEEPTQTKASFKWSDQLGALKPLLVLAFANFLMVGALEGFADVWGISYLMHARDLTKVQASSITSFIYVGMLFGGPILAFFAERFSAHYAVTALSGILMGLLMGAILLFNTLIPEPFLILIMLLVGVLCCYQVIVFAIGSELVPTAMLSVTIAFLNCINMLGGSFFHTIIGQVMDYVSPAQVVDGIQQYDVHAYEIALLAIPIASLIGGLMIWMMRIYARNQNPTSA